jgi:UMF1 family MFS transporter
MAEIPMSQTMMPAAPPRNPASASLLERLGLHRPELRAWAMYDWANSAMVLVIMTAVFPIYYGEVAGAGLGNAPEDVWYPLSKSLATAVVAVLSPVLGSMADFTATRKRFLATCVGVGAASVAAMWFIGPGEIVLASLLFVLASGAVSLSFVFYESLLPHIASADEVDRVSTAGYAVGYFGSGLLLIVILLWIQQPGWFGFPVGEGPGPTQNPVPWRASFMAVAIWWALFSVPLFRRVSEPLAGVHSDGRVEGSPLPAAVRRLGQTFHQIRRFRQTFLLLVAFLLYNDGINTIISMAAIYGSESLGIAHFHLILAILIVQFVGVPFAFLFGVLAGWIGTRRSILVGLAAYCGITVFGFFMTSAAHFYILACAVGVVQGGTQALSRSLFARMVPRHKASEFFGFFSVFSKFAGIFGPLVWIAFVHLSGEPRGGILSVILFFLTGGTLLLFVNVPEGERAARAAEAEEAFGQGMPLPSQPAIRARQ